MLNSRISHFFHNRTLKHIFISFIFYFLSDYWSSQRDKEKCRHCANRPIGVQFNSKEPKQSDLTQGVNSGTSNGRFSTNSCFKSFQAPCCAGNAAHAVQYWHQNANMALGFSQVFYPSVARERCSTSAVRCCSGVSLRTGEHAV